MTQGDSKNSDSDWDANIHYQNEIVAATYDDARFRSLSGRVFNKLEQRIILKAFSSLPPGSSIVDVPCGTGRLAEPLLQAGYHVHGIDISAAMLTVARQKLDSYENLFTTEIADVKDIQSCHPRYDAALCARVLMHFPLEDQIIFLSAVARLTRQFVLINHSFSSPYQNFRRRIKGLLRHPPSARFPVTSQDIESLLSNSDLREICRFRLNSTISEAVYILAERI